MLEEIKAGLKLGIGIAVGMLLVQLVMGTLFMTAGLVMQLIARI
jgi:flagellar biosynthesis protein FliP